MNTLTANTKVVLFVKYERISTFHILGGNKIGETATAVEKQTYWISVSLFLSVSTDFFLQWISIYCEVLYCRLFGQIQAQFSASVSGSPTALNSFLGLLWQYWVLGLWARQVSLSDGSPSPRTYCTLVWISGCSSGMILSLLTVDIGFSPSNSTSDIWNITVNCLWAACVCTCVCLRNGKLTMILLTMSMCK